MDELLQQAVAILRATWRRRWIGVAVAWAVAVVGAVVVARFPERYEATARIYVDTQSVLKPLMSGLAVQPDINQQIGMLARTMITRPNVEKLARMSDLDHLAATPGDRERLIGGLMKTIQLTGGGRENLYNVTFRDSKPERAKLVVQNLVSLFVESGLGDKRRDTESARKFIDEQIRIHETRLEEAENRVKEFKLRHLGLVGGTGADYFARIAALTEELNKLRTELRVAEQSRDALKRELAGEEPILLADTPATSVPATIPEIDTRIDTLRRQLDELLRRYTDEHPDVAASRRLIASLEQQKQQELEARRRAAAARAQPKLSAATNPVFQQIKIALAESETNVAALRARVGETQARVAELRSAAGRIPQIEAEMAQLNRDYEVINRNYDALVARREQAAISEDVDANAKLAEFRVIDPPRVAPTPVFPHRLALIPVVLLAAIAAGVVAAFAVGQIFPTFDSVRALRNVTQRPVLGSVSVVTSPPMLRRARLMNTAFAGSVAGLILIYGVWIVWLSLATRVA
jgi:polysaccharide chain length determinant protein (PEP-CTERM system associated)